MIKRAQFAILLFVLSLASFQGFGADDPILFPDKNLEKAVRKFVFEKRDNDKPLVEADVASLSVVQAPSRSIENLAGMEKCESLAMKSRPTVLAAIVGQLLRRPIASVAL